jgi:hypothetical protein
MFGNPLAVACQPFGLGRESVWILELMSYQEGTFAATFTNPDV